MRSRAELQTREVGKRAKGPNRPNRPQRPGKRAKLHAIIYDSSIRCGQQNLLNLQHHQSHRQSAVATSSRAHAPVFYNATFVGRLSVLNRSASLRMDPSKSVRSSSYSFRGTSGGRPRRPALPRAHAHASLHTFTPPLSREATRLQAIPLSILSHGRHCCPTVISAAFSRHTTHPFDH